MKNTMRWYGPNDGVSLLDLRQAGCSGVVTALHQVPVGEVWSVADIKERINIIEADNKTHSALSWGVVESLPVHEDIKKGLPSRVLYIENYKASLQNLAQCGIYTICYNFMPVLDWSRTQLFYQMPDGSKALRFVLAEFAVFDLYILKRENAAADYDAETIAEAKNIFENSTAQEKQVLQDTILQGLPGSKDAFELETFKGLLDAYKNIGDTELRENLYYFIQQISPEAERLGIKMCIHPDDPPRPLLGLPRVLSTEKDIEQLMAAYNHSANGLTFCTGSLGVRADNDLVNIIKRFGERIHFIHLRTTLREAKPWVFHEAPHLAGDVDFYEVIKALLEEEQKRRKAGNETSEIPMRPDHGHLLSCDSSNEYYPGYSFVGRLKGLAEIRGMESAIKRQLNP